MGKKNWSKSFVRWLDIPNGIDQMPIEEMEILYHAVREIEKIHPLGEVEMGGVEAWMVKVMIQEIKRNREKLEKLREAAKVFGGLVT